MLGKCKVEEILRFV